MTKPTISPTDQILFEKLVESIRSEGRAEGVRGTIPIDTSPLLNRKSKKERVGVHDGGQGSKYDKCEFVGSLREFSAWLQGGREEEVCSEAEVTGLHKFDALQVLFTVFILLASFRIASIIGFMINEGFIGRHNLFAFVMIMFFVTSR
jgi:hypothetical protein